MLTVPGAAQRKEHPVHPEARLLKSSIANLQRNQLPGKGTARQLVIHLTLSAETSSALICLKQPLIWISCGGPDPSPWKTIGSDYGRWSPQHNQ